MVTVEGFAFERPPVLKADEAMVAFSSAESGGPNLIVQTRPAGEGATAESLGADMLEQLKGTMPGLVRAGLSDMSFDDGGQGVVLSCSLTTERGNVRQYIVVRVHEGRVCTASVTSPNDVSQASAMALMKCLASIRPAT